ncbi:hypothetical protein [Pseudomonas amygdali]|uniref:Uncharacterized protein n=1 Tax=Pseudomonas amygdali pv. lachrymans TaxID=53707 RepID=A0ABR5KTI8_PSEAV|nr:hypothetical protein [Pseudomonas amygdali]KPC17150.1 Uncharacterized protein AC499_0352 [Pseudomonas amygdali pv. lachrymans]KPC18109.1 Uncharacterized protein AC499_1311 [Pseudomonas amygdali pv. lachrymans]
MEKLKQIMITINHDLGKAKRAQFENGLNELMPQVGARDDG